MDIALETVYTDPDSVPESLPELIQSPVAHEADGDWLKWTNMVGINVRTVGSFWNIVKYALTLPLMQDSIHILPIWEAGVVGSIYGMSSWELNPEFYSEELAQLCPSLDTIEKQLRAVINLLHVMGKSVGMDVIPHTDRYSQMSLAFPHIPGLDFHVTLAYDSSTADNVSEIDRTLIFNGKHYKVTKMLPGEGRVYRITAT